MAQLYIDTLPKLQRDAVIQAILAGVPLRKCALIANCAEGTIRTYRDTILKPLLRDPQPTVVQNTSKDDRLSRDIAEASLSRSVSVVQGLANDMMRRSTRLMDRIEDETKDLDARGWASVANVGVKTITLLGQLSGELDAGRKTDGVTIQVIMPQAPRRAELDTPDIEIDVTPR